MNSSFAIGGVRRIRTHRSAAPGMPVHRRGAVPSRSLSFGCANLRRPGGPSTSGAFSFPQGREAGSSRVAHNHYVAGSNAAPATSLPSLKWIPRSCGPP